MLLNQMLLISIKLLLYLILVLSKMKKEIIAKICEECPEVEDIHHLHVHRYGKNIELTIHIRLDPKMLVEDSHDISFRIEKKLREKMNCETTVHVEPLISQS